MAEPAGDPAADGPVAAPSALPPVRLNIVILSLGTRGDLWPKLEIAKILARRHGHRVRFAGHPLYRETVEAQGIEFYSTGRTDPRVLQVRRQLPREEFKALIPTMLDEFREMGERWWGACIGDPAGLARDGHEVAPESPFVADAVISVMQVFDQTSIVARMGVPLHMLGTNARTSSKYVPHSQAESYASGDGGKFKNKFSYYLFDTYFSQMMKEIYNNLRVNIMGLEPYTPVWQLTQFNRMRVPYTYIWSPALLPKAPDWGDHIDIAGFVYHDEPDYSPPQELVDFLEASEQKPIYVGFGSMGFPDNAKVFREVFAAIKQAGVRAVVARGWSEFERPHEENPNVYIIDEAPHGWLFPRVEACVIHGGAGTVARALKTGVPAVIVAIAGDQLFWGHRVHKAGCGPEPLPIKELTADRLAEKIIEVQKPQYAAAAADLGSKIAAEAPGQEGFVKSALKTFSIYETEGRCDILLDRPAVWKVKTNGAKLSALAAHLLVQEGKVKQSSLGLWYAVKWPDLISPGDPISGVIKAVGLITTNVKNDFKMMGRKSEAANGHTSDSSQEKPAGADKEGSHGPQGTALAVPLGMLFLILHVLRSPLTLFVALTLGFYNFIDWFCYELGSRSKPDMFASNPRLYSYPQMIMYLFLRFPSELISVITGPGEVVSEGRSIGRGIQEVPVALLRALLAALNILVGFFALTLRALDIELSRLMGERPKDDVVAQARICQGKLEAEQAVQTAAEEGSRLQAQVIKGWDEKFGRRV